MNASRTVWRKTPLVLQSEAAECALAALCMIAGHHGQPLDLLEARQKFSASLKGATVGDLVVMGQSLGLAARPLRLEPHEMKALDRPAVLHWRMNHFVVLTAVRRRGIVIHDPALGRCEVPWKEVDDAFTGIAVEFTPTVQFPTSPSNPRIALGRIWRALPGAGRFAAQFFLLSIAAQCIAMMTPYLFQLVIDDALVSHDTGMLLAVVMGLVFLAGFDAVINAVRGWGVAVTSAHLSRHLHWNLMRHLLSLALPFFEKRHAGDILTRVASLEAVQAVITTSVTGIAVDGTVVLFTGSMLCIYDLSLGLLAVGMLAALAVLRLALYPKQRRLDDLYLHQQAYEHTHTLETLRAMPGIRAVNGESRRLARASELMTRRIGAGLDVARFQLGTTLLENLLQGALHTAVIGFAASRVMHSPETFSLGMLFAFMAWKNQFSERAASLVGHLIACRLLDLHLTRIADITLEPAVVTGNRTGTRDRLSGAIRGEKLGFRHGPGEPWILRDLHFEIREGAMTAIIGASGAGKTTLARLLLGLYEPAEGEIRIGDVPLCRDNAPLWRRSCGVVLQDDQLLSGTIADNIAFHSGDMDLERVERAAHFAGLHENVRRMPMGYLTLVGDLGSTLSSGQKQRLLIARALYREPEVLLLDEGSAHLDPASEDQLAEQLANVPCTRIVIAHRPSWVRRADLILELADGRLTDVTHAWREAQRSFIRGRIEPLDLQQKT